MEFRKSDILEDDFNELRPKANELFFKNDIRNNLKNPPVFTYSSIDLDKTEYHFNQKEFTNEDIKKYFSILKKFSNLTIGKILDLKHENHVYESKLKGKLLEVYKKYTNKKNVNVDEVPPIYHFALYTDGEGNASRASKIKSPRIYFTVGGFGTIHILFYDPYHEINQTCY